MTKVRQRALLPLAACCIAGWHGAAAAATITWTASPFAAQAETFTAEFDAVPSTVDQDTVIGLSSSQAAAYTGLAAIVRFNDTGQIDARNGGGYSAATAVPYVAQATYRVRMVVNVPANTYSAYVTPPGQPEQTLAVNYAFRTEQAGASSLGFIDEGASLGTVAVNNFVLSGSQSGSGGNCPFTASAAAAGISNDGCAGATAGAAQYPDLLSVYGSHRPPFDVAGVDYAVGVPAGALKDPSISPLPPGCSYAANVVTCSQSGTTISGYDFSLHGEIQLVIAGGVSNVTATGNNFVLGSTCKDPVISINAGGAVVLSHNTINGNGGLCKNQLVWGTLVNGGYANGATLTVEYNEFYNTPQDVTDNRGPSSGSASIIERYNLFYLQGYTGHPDGIQLNGGNFNGIDVSFNTYYNVSPPSTNAGTQPFHIEAQLTAAVSNSTVSYNTIVTPGTCSGGRDWPVGCAVNYDIACKNDTGWVDSNTNFAAYGNYIDWSGAIAALANGYRCPSTSWGVPVQNIDMKTGAVLAP